MSNPTVSVNSIVVNALQTSAILSALRPASTNTNGATRTLEYLVPEHTTVCRLLCQAALEHAGPAVRAGKDGLAWGGGHLRVHQLGAKLLLVAPGFTAAYDLASPEVEPLAWLQACLKEAQKPVTEARAQHSRETLLAAFRNSAREFCAALVAE